MSDWVKYSRFGVEFLDGKGSPRLEMGEGEYVKYGGENASLKTLNFVVFSLSFKMEKNNIYNGSRICPLTARNDDVACVTVAFSRL